MVKLLDNIPQEQMFESTCHQINSPGWILGHLIVEIQDIFNHFNVSIKPLPKDWFLNESQKIINVTKLPNKEVLLDVFKFRYDFLMNFYKTLSEKERLSKHPSTMFSSIYTNVDAWIVHHLITHVAVHIGNITVWKKINNIDVNGM